MHQTVEWIRPSDRIILQNIASYGGWIKPSSIYLNVGYSQQHVQRRCKELANHNILERHDEDVAYRPSELGRKWLLGEATPQMLLEQN